jgi:hypothetical protein
MNFLRAFVLAGIGYALTLLPAAAEPPVPKEPPLHRAPEFASWTVTYQYKDDSKKDGKAAAFLSNSPATFTVTKTKKIFWEKTILVSGKSFEKWVWNGYQLESLPDSPSIVPISQPTPETAEPEYSDYSRTDFRGLDWISMSAYRGVQNYEGKQAFLFESTVRGHKVTALLSIEWQLPILSTEDDTTQVYVFNTSPSEMLTLPPRFQAVLIAYKKGLESLKFHPSPP